MMSISLGFGQERSSLPSLEQLRNSISERFNTNYPSFVLNKEALKQKAIQRGIPLLLKLENNEIAELNYFDESDSPVYYTIFNTQAAITTSTNALQVGGSLGLNLTGKGMTVGIYDQTRPKPDHVEFQGRLTQVDGSTETISNHATHVSGTIMAGGVNANAKGMAAEATAWAFNWESDLSKMNVNAYDPVTKLDGHLVSNHSYGIVLGWYRNASNAWVWAGNASVDPKEEYRFGFYGGKSKGLDDLIFAKPYYTVVWAAGNDRNDSGDGTRNPDGPDDNIGPEGVAKNAITVGAVSSVIDYAGPQSVAISSFSSVGPVDDGRIKPDVVAMGVNVFSSAISNGGTTDSYATLSGTSMASPNVTGSLLLLQQLYSNRNSGRYMWASTLKGLMINTTKEAGANPGPDYTYGWGLLNTEAAAEIILNENGSSDVIREERLVQGGKFENEFISDGVTPIRVTIAWTDPSGNSPSPSVNPQNLMLVNDLDLRIVDEEGNTYFPYTLDPALRLSAKAENTSDNFRDNVEQIYIPNPKAQRYRIVVTHKGELKNGLQDFSFISKAGTADGAAETLYWIGSATGDWANPMNWSATSNGPAANRIPGTGTRVVFEGSNSGSITVNFLANANAFSVNLFGNQLVNFDLKGNTIALSNGLRISNQITSIKNGKLVFANQTVNDQLVALGEAVFDGVEIQFNAGNWQILEAGKLDQVSISNAKVRIGFATLKLNKLSMTGLASLLGELTAIEVAGDFSIAATATIKDGLALKFDGVQGNFVNNTPVPLNSLSVESGTLTLVSGGFKNLNLVGAKTIQKAPSIQVDSLTIGPGSELNLDQASELIVLNNIIVTASSTSKASITATGKGKLTHNLYKKYCFENLSVSNVDHEGNAIINLGVGASITNATGWLSQNCPDVLFANFRSNFNCVGAAISFENLSEGAISSYLWDFGGKGTSTERNPIFVFDQAGAVVVKLTVSNSSGSTVFNQTIDIGLNELVKPTIVINGNVLTSQQPGTSYQWYINSKLVEGATSRSLEARGDGLYQVAIFNTSCNRISDPVVISAIPDQEVELSRFGFFVGPIPTSDKLNITISNGYRGPVILELLDMAGRSYLINESTKTEEEIQLEMRLNGPVGLYILRIQTNNLTLHKKVIKY
jgi:PKD repeat protein